MRRIFKWTAIVLCFNAVIAAPGCNRSPYELAPVHGKVLVDGRPLTRAKVMFAPAEAGDNVNPGKPAFGMLQSDGSFTLTTYTANDGAVLGEHWVTIVNLSDGGAKSAPSAPSEAFSRLSLPDRVKVQADVPNEFDFNISADQIKRFGIRTGE